MIIISSRDNSAMEEFFEKRTNKHISLVQKYLSQIQDLNLEDVDSDIQRSLDYGGLK